MTNTLYSNDNLFVLKGMNSESVNLVYLDPPFNSKRMYSAPIGSRAAGTSFKDMWSWQDVNEAYLDKLIDDYPLLTDFIKSIQAAHSKAMMAYVTYMTQRLIELHRVLKNTGAIYLHCDSTASHYLKIVLDQIFGKENFRNEIVWRRTFAHNDPKQFGRNKDNIFFYVKSKAHRFNRIYTEYSDDYKKAYFNKSDDRGAYQLVTLTGPGTNFQDGQWRGYHPADGGRSWSIPKRIVRELTGGQHEGRMTKKEKLDLLYEHGYIVFSKKGVPRFKSYLCELPGVPGQEIWVDINPVSAHSKERTGYPTQKPLKLLHRIIKASSNEGDIVLDPFCGCATTCVAAQQLNRQWIGIDIETRAAEILIQRLSDDAGIFKDFIHRADIPNRTDIKTESIDQAVKQRLYHEQDGKCHACATVFEIQHLEVDHIVPKSKGGGDYYENYQLLCSHCNRVKGDRPMEYLRTKIKSRQAALSQHITFGE